MAFKIIKNVIIVLSILFGLHFFLYRSSVFFFSLSHYKDMVLYGIVSLTLSYPLLIVIDRFIHNTLTRILAGAMGLWLALMLYLIIGFGILWPVYWFLNILGLRPPNAGLFFYFKFGLLGCILFMISYGFILAWKIQTTHVDVNLNKLPAYWKNKKVLQISDVHIGAIWGNGRLKKIAKTCEKLKPDLVLITGDLFDGASSSHRRYLPGLKALAKSKPPEGIFFTSGNHERYSDYSKIMPLIEESGIQVLENRLVNLNGLQVVGIQYPDFSMAGKKQKAAEDIVYDFRAEPKYSKELPVIMLYHVPVDYRHSPSDMGELQKGAYLNPNTDFENARLSGVDLQLSGHTHAGQIFPFIGLTRRIFHGFHYGLHKVGKFQIYVHAGTGTWGVPVRHRHPSEVALICLK